MEEKLLQITSTGNLNVECSTIQFTNPDGSKVSIGKDESKVVRITAKDNVLYVEEIK